MSTGPSCDLEPGHQPTSLALVVHTDQSITVSSSGRADDHSDKRQIIAYSRLDVLGPGPGYALHLGYEIFGSSLRLGVGKIAYCLGCGPVAIMEKIEKAFHTKGRTSLLEEVFEWHKGVPGSAAVTSGAVKQLLNLCGELLEYAFPSEMNTDETRDRTFRCLVVLITRFPGIRKLFTCHATFKGCKSQDDVLTIWDGSEIISEEETLKFFLEFAAFAMMGNEITDTVEKLSPSELTCLDDVACTFDFLRRRCHGGTNPKPDYSEFLAVRYLSGILEMPEFWVAAKSHHVEHICDIVLVLIDDPRMEDDAAQFDRDGVDGLAASVLGGLTKPSTLSFLEGGKLDNLRKQLCENKFQRMLPVACKEALMLTNALFYKEIDYQGSDIPNTATRLPGGASTEMRQAIKLHITTHHRREYDIRLSQSKLVEDLVIAVHSGHNVYPYHKGRRMRLGCRLSEYELQDGARIELRTERFSLNVISNLQRVFGMNDADIKKLHEEFHRKHGYGTLNKSEFYAHYGDKNGHIDINEWVFAKNILEAGGTTRLKFIFDFFDIDGDGYITKSELMWICVPLCQLNFEDQQLDENQARLYVRHVFQQLDRDRDGRLSFEEFRLGYYHYSFLRPDLLTS